MLVVVIRQHPTNDTFSQSIFVYSISLVDITVYLAYMQINNCKYDAVMIAQQ